MRTLGNPFRVGVVLRYYVRDERPVADVRTTEGAVFVGAPLRLLGASVYPVSVGQRVHLYFPLGTSDLPYIVGADSVTGALPESVEQADGQEDYSPSWQDLTLQHAGNTVSLSASGVTVDPGSQSVRFQLTSGQVLRISLNGAVMDSPLAGQAFIDALFPLLLDYHARLVAVEAKITALTGAVPEISELPGDTQTACTATLKTHIKL